MPLTLEAKLIAAALALLALLGGVLYLQHHERAIGAAQCEAKTAQDDAARARAAAEQHAANEHAGAVASQSYQAAAAVIASRQPETRHAIQTALSAPIVCPAGPAPALADLVLPAAALDGLRRAAGGAADSAATR